MREKLSLFLVLLLLMTTPLQVFAQSPNNFSDMPVDWSTEALETALNNGLLNGHEGNIRPRDLISRAEIATVINRAFGAHVTVSLDGFVDVEGEDWYYLELAKAVAMGTLKGDGNTLRPDSPVTREEAFTILGRALSIKSTETDKTFKDLSAVSNWAKEATLGLVNEDYVIGSEGYLNPKAQITRAEFAQLMHNIIKNYIRTPGIVEDVKEGNVMISTSDVTLKEVTVTGDLIIGDGVGEGEVTLEDVTVKGRLLVRGGGENSIVIRGDSDIGSITIVKNGNRIRVLNESGKTIQVSEIEGDADVILEGNFKNVIIQSPDITIHAVNAEIDGVEINGVRSKIIIDEDSKIYKIDVTAANVVIEGSGDVKEVEVFVGGTGATILTPNTAIDVNKGANNVIGTGEIEIDPNETYVNGKTETQDAKPLKQESSRSSGGSSGGSNTPPTTTYKLNYSVIGNNGTLSATKTNGSSVNSGTSVTFTATPAENYEIKEWKINGAVVTGGNTLTRSISVNTTVTVEFRWTPEPERFSVLYYTASEGGTISSSINSGVGVLPNTELTFTATPDAGYEVKEWKVNDVVVEAGNTLTTTITAYTRVTVEFREMPPLRAIINNTNVLRIESNQPIQVFDDPVWEEEDKALLLADIFMDGQGPDSVAEKYNMKKVEITMEDTALEIKLLSGVFDNDFFWNLDRPDGEDPGYDRNPYPFDGDGNGVYRKDILLDLSRFGYWEESELIPIKLKLYVPFEHGAPNYDKPVQAAWQTVTQSEEDEVRIRDNTPPEFISITSNVGAPGSEIWVDEGEIIEFYITASDENLKRVSVFNNKYGEEEEGYWYYADEEDVYNGPTEAGVEEAEVGVTVTYLDGTWTINLGEEVSSFIPDMDFDLEFEDYAGNKWSDIETNESHRMFLFEFYRIDRSNLDNVVNIIENYDPLNYTNDSWTTFLDEYTYIMENMPETKQEEVEDKVEAIDMAISFLEAKVAVTQVDIDIIDTNIIVGQTYNLTATVLPSDASDSSVWWMVISGPGVIDEDTGEFWATSVGEIVVKASSYSDSVINDLITFTAKFPGK